MTMNLTWIDDFMALAASGNFSRAAEERHMTQPAFSRRIRALEDWLGAELFDRSSQPARVTEVGEWFRTAAQDLQARVAVLPGEARALAESSAATLRVACTHALSFTFLPRWWQQLEAHAPLGPLQLVSDVQLRCEALLAQRQVHFMLAHGHPGVPVPGEEGDDALWCVVGTDLLLPVSAPNAQGHPLHDPRTPGQAGPPVHWLSYSAESGLGRLLRELQAPALAQLAEQGGPPVLTAHLASVLRTMALAGRGLAWLPRLLVDDDLAAGRLVPAGPPEWRIDLQVRLHRQPATLSRAAQAFWAAATAQAGVMGNPVNG